MAVTEGNDGTETGCVHFVRGRVVEVTDWPIHPSEEGKLIIRAEDTLAGFVRRIPVDMVVLSVGVEPKAMRATFAACSISVARDRKGEPISEVTRCLSTDYHQIW